MSSIEQGWRIGAESDTGSCLLIIGNGFDLHHGLATGYSDYHDWLVDHDEQVATDFETFCFARNAQILRAALTTYEVPPKVSTPDGALLKNHSALNGTTFVMKRSITRIQM